MPENRGKFSNIVQNQLPAYVQEDFPLVAEFFKSYYQGQEYQSGPLDLLQNIDQYIKVQEQTNLQTSVNINKSVSICSFFITPNQDQGDMSFHTYRLKGTIGNQVLLSP